MSSNKENLASSLEELSISKSHKMPTPPENNNISDISKANQIEKRDGYFLLPNESWARRVVGVMAHRINEESEGPHVIAIDKGNTLQISLRGRNGIGELCAKFGGGGRATAGGIDNLPKSEITALMNEVNSRRSA